MKALLLVAGCWLLACVPAHAQLVGRAPVPELSPAGLALIYEFEVGGAGRLPNGGHPEWPGFASGVTVGIGYDCGYNSAPVIRSDWARLSGVDRLATTAGVTGSRARGLLGSVRDIIVSWKLAAEVFNGTTLAKFYGQAARAFPGMQALRPNAQAALVSLVFNRGSSLVGARREEMREIARLVPRKDYDGIAEQLRRMKRLWRGTDIQAGMYRRREAEAALVLTP